MPNEQPKPPPEPKPSPILLLGTVLPAVTSLISTLVWPVFAVWVIWFVADHHTALVCDIARVSPYIQTGEIHAGPFSASLQTTQSIANALSSGTPPTRGPASASSAEGALTPVSPEAAQKLAAQAVQNLDAFGIAAASTALRILWVDPHPGNNINLQIAFQKLGFVVVTIQDDDVIPEAFRLAQSFNVVITNMNRGDNEAEGGLNTIKTVQGIQPGIPVIVYSAQWAQINLGKEETYGVSLISNRTDLVFQKVVDIAQALIKSAPRAPATAGQGPPSLNPCQ